MAQLVAQPYKDASRFYLNVNFEVLNGCKFKCRGCHVEKNAQTPFTGDELVGVVNFLSDCENDRYSPFIAFVGPTDFLVSTNLVSLLADVKIVEALRRFKRIAFQTTFLNFNNAPQAAQALRDAFHDRELEINIVLEPSRAFDDQYLRRIEDNRSHFMKMLNRQDVRSFAILNVYNYEETRVAEKLTNYTQIHDRIKEVFGTTIDYNFSSGRDLNLSSEDFISIARVAQNIFNKSLSQDAAGEKLRFSFGKMTDSLLERQLNYRSGNFYYSPLLYERFVSFHPDLKIAESGIKVGELETYINRITLNQLRFAPQTTECESCPFLGTCVERGVLQLMNIYNLKDCIVAKDALYAVNSMQSEIGRA